MTIDTSEPKVTRFCQIKKQIQKGYLYAIGFSMEALAIWFTYLVARFATSAPITVCPEGSAGSVCPTDVALAMVLSLVVTGLILAFYVGELLKYGFKNEDGAFNLALLPLMIAFAVSFVYLFVVGGLLAWTINGIMFFIAYESILSIPAIILGVIVVATLVYAGIHVACEIELRRERMEKAKRDITAQAAANKPQG